MTPHAGQGSYKMVNTMAWCSGCKQEMDSSKFWRDRTRFNGLCNLCKKCYSSSRKLLWNRGASKRWKIKNREKVRAHRFLYRAILKGEIKRPKECSMCHRIPAPTRDGRSNIHAHHHNGYSNWWYVLWLCQGCHKLVHAKKAA